MSFYAGRTGTDKAGPRLSGLTALTIIVRDAPSRWARLCATMPHRWYPVGNMGQLCIRCSQFRVWNTRA